MSPAALGKLAHRLAKSKSRAESAKLKARITEGFYARSQCQRFSARTFRVRKAEGAEAKSARLRTRITTQHTPEGKYRLSAERGAIVRTAPPLVMDLKKASA